MRLLFAALAAVNRAGGGERHGRSRAEHRPTTETAPGRRPRDPDRTKRDILVAAREEFVEHGLDGARVDRIAERAGANKRMLYHYVGNKEALYARVLLDAYREIRSGERDLQPRRPCRRALAMEKLVGFTFDHFRANPWFIRLLATENIQRGAFVRAIPDIRALNSPLVEQVAEVLAAGEAEGIFRAGRRPAPALHHADRRQLFLPLEHPHPLRRLRRPPRLRTPRWPAAAPTPSRSSSATFVPENRLRRNNQRVTLATREPGERASLTTPRGRDPLSLREDQMTSTLTGATSAVCSPGRAAAATLASVGSFAAAADSVRLIWWGNPDRDRRTNEVIDLYTKDKRRRRRPRDLRLGRLLAEARHPGGRPATCPTSSRWTTATSSNTRAAGSSPT